MPITSTRLPLSVTMVHSHLDCAQKAGFSAKPGIGSPLHVSLSFSGFSQVLLWQLHYFHQDPAVLMGTLNNSLHCQETSVLLRQVRCKQTLHSREAPSRVAARQ